LILAHGNPHGTKRLADVHAKQLRLVDRQQTAGSYLLLIHLLEPADLSRQDLNLIDNTARSETDVAVTLLDGKADAGGYRHRGRGAPVSA
jgi:putative molybdopterin biosynthesis protein